MLKKYPAIMLLFSLLQQCEGQIGTERKNTNCTSAKQLRLCYLLRYKLGGNFMFCHESDVIEWQFPFSITWNLHRYTANFYLIFINQANVAGSNILVSGYFWCTNITIKLALVSFLSLINTLFLSRTQLLGWF